MFGRRLFRKPATAPRDAWYRSSDWDAQARAEFETRLARATPYNQVQYRRIKALALLDSRDRKKQAAGRDLLEGILRERDVRHEERLTALSVLAAHEQDVGRLDDAERHLRDALRMMSWNASGSTKREDIQLAEILLARGGQVQLEEARDLLERRVNDPPFLLADRFRLCVAGARVSLALNDKASAADWAAAGLQAAAATHSGLRYHPVLGLVKTDARTRAWLTAVAKGRA